MAVKIRLARHGRKKRPFYRIVAADSESRRDGRYLELLGRLNTLSDPPTVTLDIERVKYWIGVGARPTETAYQLIERELPGYLQGIEQGRRQKLQSRRAKRKARQQAAEAA